MWEPNHKAQAIGSIESASFNPKDNICIVCKESDTFSDETAYNRAFSLFAGAERIKLLYLFLLMALSQGLSGMFSFSASIFHS